MAYGVGGGKAGIFETRAQQSPDRGGVEQREALANLQQQIQEAGVAAAKQAEVDRLQQANQALQMLSRQEARMSQLPGSAGAIANFNVRNMAQKIAEGGVPAFGPRGVANVQHKGFLGGQVMSGMPVNAYEDYMRDVQSRAFAPEPVTFVPQETPMPTQVAAAPVEIYDLGDAYYIPSLLDRTPQGLLEVGGEPFDFEAANRAFRRRSATRPSYFQDPYDIEGMSLLA